MKCEACGYDDHGNSHEWVESATTDKGEKIQIVHKTNTSPFRKYYIKAAITTPGFIETEVLFACPNCGTVRMEV